MHLRDAFLRTASAYPSKPALVESGEATTYAEWERRIERVAAGLVRLGVRPGDRVLLAAGGTGRHATVFWACQFLNAASVHVNPRLKPEELAAFLGDSEPVLAFLPAAAVDAVPVLNLDDAATWRDLSSDDAQPAALPEPDERAISHMVYTSGSTGRPKGIPLSHRQAYARALAGAVHLGLEPEDRVLGAMPFFHTMGVVAQLTLCGVLGCTFHAVPAWDPAAALELIERDRVTSFFGSPTHYAMLAAEAARGERDLRCFRKPAYGGGPLSASLLDFWHRTLETDLVQAYGTTETMWTLVSRHSRRKPGCAGRPGLHHRLRLVAEGSSDPTAVVAPGERGELIVEVGSAAAREECFTGYWRQPEAYAAAVRDGWYFTGDAARVDEDGDHWITGRIKNLIRSGAESIQPEEVEQVLSRHPRVSDVAVLGLPDETWGEVVAAVIVASGPISDAELRDHCAADVAMADFKRPRRFAFVSQIPRNVSGKLVREQAIAFFSDS